MNILIAEPMSAAGIEHFRAQSGWNVIVSNPKEYGQHLAEADALLVRSAVQVTKDVLAQAPKRVRNSFTITPESIPLGG